MGSLFRGVAEQTQRASVGQGQGRSPWQSFPGQESPGTLRLPQMVAIELFLGCTCQRRSGEQVVQMGTHDMRGKEPGFSILSAMPTNEVNGFFGSTLVEQKCRLTGDGEVMLNVEPVVIPITKGFLQFPNPLLGLVLRDPRITPAIPPNMTDVNWSCR